jgi:hypothetical protein
MDNQPTKVIDYGESFFADRIPFRFGVATEEGHAVAYVETEAQAHRVLAALASA